MEFWDTADGRGSETVLKQINKKSLGYRAGTSQTPRAVCAAEQRGWLFEWFSSPPDAAHGAVCTSPSSAVPGMCSLAHQIPFPNLGLRLPQCWLLFHLGKIVPTSDSPASSSLLVDTGDWRKDYRYIRSVLLLDALLHLTCFPNRCRFLHCWFFFITQAVFKIRIGLERLFIMLLKFVIWAPWLSLNYF